MTLSQAIDPGLVVLLDEFLVHQELTRLERFIAQAEPSFAEARVVLRGFTDPAVATAVLAERRSARFIHAPEWLYQLLNERFRLHLPFILDSLAYPAYELDWLEAQITASNDGDFFARHNDDHDANMPRRETTYVYFCHKEPRIFEGGELVVHPPAGAHGAPIRIQPARNSVVLFPSSLTHEILPVRCPSRNFAHSRFTVNGWLRGPLGKGERDARWRAHYVTARA
jgi:Rps23 Pro-64 3,4-dihydroxylase Tpa1-like proline 4-hydroxylase